MNRLEYLQSIRTTNPKEIYDTWTAMGSLEVSSATKLYVQGTLFKVKAVRGDLRDALVYCKSEYLVDESHEVINWEDMTTDKTQTLCNISGGITSPCFVVILTMSEQMAFNKDEPIIEEKPLFPQSKEISSNFIIPEVELQRILVECGVPFIRVEELEYTREQIISLAVVPAVQEFYSFFPIIEEQFLGNFGAGQEFLIPFIPYAFNGVVYYTIGNGAGGGYPGFSSAFSFMGEQYAMGGFGMGTGRYGKGVCYPNKVTPGWTGLGVREANFMGRQLQQAWINLMRKERTHTIYKDGKRYLHGFSTIGGSLNCKWCKWDNNWDAIDFEQLKDVRRLATAYVLRNLAAIRCQVKNDSPANIDYSLFSQRADAIEDKITQKWDQSSTNLRWTVERGSAAL